MLLNPDDNSPSKSRFITNHFKDNGTEHTLEVRSAYEGVGTQRIGELVLWKSHDTGAWTVRSTDEEPCP